MTKKLDTAFIYFNKLFVTFYAGNGEAYIKKVNVFKDDKWQEVKDREIIENCEYYFDGTISVNEHNDEGGTGSILCENGQVKEVKFEKYYF